ncbi:T9SS type A sorting domain-containing protein [Snuella lapsa]|uniref:Secretion system C-terminal sorting domain-containing protein n=1 Tax=Snuella lapsa TaxID=870481 RepID=A0ABP6YAJ5_9FLAO
MFKSKYANTTNNTLRYNFNSTISLYAVTAGTDNITLSADNLNTLNIKIYPNPSTDKINIVTPLKTINSTLFNAFGQIVLQTDQKAINTTHLANGVYILKIKDATTHKTETIKVIKH